MTSAYQRGQRRMLLDMHIPDWEPAFLSKYDPIALADLYAKTGVQSVMLYTKSHVGLCYWPTEAGKMHDGLHGRDVVGELVDALGEREIATCAYYSVVFDNWAAAEHPDWRQRTQSGHDLQSVTRYGWCCLNNDDYRAYERAQIDDLLGRYCFDALFLDMPFWPLICGCDACKAAYGQPLPTMIDWTDPAWCAFHAARERWSYELIEELATRARAITAGLAVYHNLAPAWVNWVWGESIGTAALNDFVGADLYGDATEQLVVAKMMLNLTESRPAEFMTTRTVDLNDHVKLKSEAVMAATAAAATACGAAFLFIDAVDPDGSVQPAVYERLERVFGAIAPYEEYLGGTPIEDIGVYFSIDSQVDLADNGTAVTSAPLPSTSYPHMDSLRGACTALQRAHLPFGVITARQLADLDNYRVIVLPNIARMGAAEAEAFRAYVENGGALYASRRTSLLDTAGGPITDFALADLFGVSYVGEEEGQTIFLRPVEAIVASVIAPQTHVSQAPKGIPRVVATTGAPVATLTLPYGHPSPGAVTDGKWASIHASPPWDGTDHPVIVRNGRVIYSTFDVERSSAEANESLFVHLIGSLLGDAPPSFEVDTHPAVWVNAFDQPEHKRVIVTLLNYQTEQPSLPVAARVTYGGTTAERTVELLDVIEFPY